MIKIPVAKPFLGSEEIKNVNKCLKDNWISSKGIFINKFESEFAKYINVKYALSCSNGTVALHLALLALDIKKDDEVILPSFTYIATANAVKYCNAKPVFVDIKKETWNINPDEIEKKITEKTKAIVVVHLYGNPVEMEKILKIARKYKLFVVEDAAEAHGALYNNKYVGSLGDINTFSFYGNKIITTGEGGMITTNNKAFYEKIKLLKGQGMSEKKRYWFDIVGYNYRMTNIQAAIGFSQLQKIKKFLKKREEIKKWYLFFLKKFNLLKYFELQKAEKNSQPVCWLFSLKVAKQYKNLINRDKLMNFLLSKGIETRPLFYPITEMPPYKNLKLIKADLPNTYEVAYAGLNLPTFYELKKGDVEYIVKNIKAYIDKISKRLKNIKLLQP